MPEKITEVEIQAFDDQMLVEEFEKACISYLCPNWDARPAIKTRMDKLKAEIIRRLSE